MHAERAYMTGVQALVRIPLVQRELDERAGLETAAFISGYRGSPVGTYDQMLWKAKKTLEAKEVHFEPGLNEDLAATAVWGSQLVGMPKYGEATKDGVIGIWYGKGPGVDRSGDALKHANLVGTSKYGGVLCIFGDDHTCKSSTLPHQSEHAIAANSIPILHPTGVEETLDFGLMAIAQSRYTGCWVGMKVTTVSMDSSESVNCSMSKITYSDPPGGDLDVHARVDELKLVKAEDRLNYVKLPAVKEWWYHNALKMKQDMVRMGGPKGKLGVLTAGKSFTDVKKALERMGMTDDETIAAAGISVFKLGMTYPLEPRRVTAWAAQCETVLVVEEKREFIESQLKEVMFNADVKPKIIGKNDLEGKKLLTANLQLEPYEIEDAFRRVLGWEPRAENQVQPLAAAVRTPYFCAGCPHNTSTLVPEGSKAMAGIGCHTMAMFMDGRNTLSYAQMGAEGTQWIGMHRFMDQTGNPALKQTHMFQNMGDGTYSHSGLLAIRAAVNANRTSPMNLTYKILFNDAAAMTGGQAYEGGMSPGEMSRQLKAEGVWPIYIVTDNPRDFKAASGVVVEHRDHLDAVQRILRETPGVSGLIYEQTCAAEKRRRRKRQAFPDPPQRIFISPRVCEGCGDCGVQSNCVALTPIETTFGRKRRIDQSACNKDYSCLKAFCPAMVEVKNGKIKKKSLAKKQGESMFPHATLPEPAVRERAGILCTGIGGTGVVTIGALVGMAGHLEGKGVQVLDEVGLAQKGGAVVTHIQVASTPGVLSACRVDKGEADTVLAFDLVTAAAPDNFDRMRPNGTFAICNTSERMVGHFARRPDLQLGQQALLDRITAASSGTVVANFDDLALKLCGDALASNMMALGAACQAGALPVKPSTLEKAIRINGVTVEANLTAFMWGRQCAHDLDAVENIANPQEVAPEPETLEEIVASRVAELSDWAGGDTRVAAKFEAAVRRAQAAEQAILPEGLRGHGEGGDQPLAEAVAKYYYKLLAYKDEFEVGRLHTQNTRDALGDAFVSADGRPLQLRYSLGHEAFNYVPGAVIRALGGSKHGTRGKVMMPGWLVDPTFASLAALRGFRFSPLNVFNLTHDRKFDFELIKEYEDFLEEMTTGALTPESYRYAVRIASLPEKIRGYGFVRERHHNDLATERAELEERFRNGLGESVAAVKPSLADQVPGAARHEEQSARKATAA
jgi:indolepyruvate ferredoxin oxidoreductase